MGDQQELEYVGFWLRVWAAFIDTLLVFLILIPLAEFVFKGKSYSIDMFGEREFVIETLLPALAVIAFWTHRGATPGKMAIGASIVDARTGEPPSPMQFVGRYVGYFLSAIPLLAGLFWVGLDRRKQGWHDKLASTVVVRPRRAGGGEAVRFEAPAKPAPSSDGGAPAA